MPLHSQQMLYVFAALLCAGIGSIHDIKDRRIPNVLTGPSIVFALLLHLLLGGWTQIGSSALAGLIAGLVMLVFFIAGGLGAGDVKLMTAVGCFVGMPLLPQVMISTFIIGALFAIVLALYRGRLRQTLVNVVALAVHHRQQGLTQHPDLNLRNISTLRLPYALPIAAGVLTTAAILATRG
jgi:prepilin peptidase CpaA